MAASDLINLSGLLDDAKCFALVRQHRWPEGARCPVCGSGAVIRDGHDDTQPCRQRYRCKACSGRFDDLTGTVLAGHHQPLRVTDARSSPAPAYLLRGLLAAWSDSVSQ